MGVRKGDAVHRSSKMEGGTTLSLPQTLPFIAGNIQNEVGVLGLSDYCAEVPQVYVLVLVICSFFFGQGWVNFRLGFKPTWNCSSCAYNKRDLSDFSFLLVANGNFAEKMPVLFSRNRSRIQMVCTEKWFGEKTCSDTLTKPKEKYMPPLFIY